MAKTLQDQLIQAGLAEPDQARKPAGKRGKPARRGPKKRKAGKDEARRAQSPRQTRDAAASPDADAQEPVPRNAREATAWARRIVAGARLDRRKADIPFRYTLGQRVKEITVTREQQRQLAAGEAAIVNIEGRFDVVPRAAAERVARLDARAVVLLNEPGADDAAEAEHPVPDDLMW